MCGVCVVFFKQKTAYEVRISDWSSDVCSSDLEKNNSRPSQLIVGRASKPEELRAPRWLAGPKFSEVLERVETQRSGPPNPPARVESKNNVSPSWVKIDRASCRERVCQYV